jgi:hypothetical protein
MKTLNQQDTKLLEKLFQLTQPSLLRAMDRYLKSKYDTVYTTDKFIIAVGDIPVGLVAHLDTVFIEPPKEIYYDRIKNVMWSPDGLGADDRAGVFSIINIIKNDLRPTIIFTTDEESGCIGSDALVKYIEKEKIDFDLKYLIQLDRRGSNDCVFYDCDVPEFEDYVESFGFVTNFGSFSDISVLCPEMKVAGVNLSIGYYNEHSTSETLHIGQMLETIKRVKLMLNDAKNAEYYVYKSIPYKYTGTWGKKTTLTDFEWDPSWGISKADWDKWMSPQMACCECGVKDFEYNLMPIFDNGEKKYCCVDCYTKNDKICWCDACNSAFIAETPDVNICKECAERLKND